MLCQTIPIRVDYARAGTFGKGEPTLHTYIREKSPEMPLPPRPAIVICPGGAYAFTSDREAEPIALRFLDLGFQTFVLRYSVAPNTAFPGALLELAASVALVRDHAEEWGIDPDKIFVCGFSAGGHLAASLGVFWDREFVAPSLGRAAADVRPNGMVLGYPVISATQFIDTESIENVLLGNDTEETRALVSLEKQVTADTPPAFIWHTAADDNVAVENSLMFAAALRENDVPFALHIVPDGRHGLSLAQAETGMVEEQLNDWPAWCAAWIRSR